MLFREVFDSLAREREGDTEREGVSFYLLSSIKVLFRIKKMLTTMPCYSHAHDTIHDIYINTYVERERKREKRLREKL